MSEPRHLLRARGLGKQFKLYDHPHDRAREWLSLGRRSYHRDFWALRDIDVELNAGECLGVIGTNGSGKSTMLKILSGSLQPTEGSVEMRGRVLALIELAAGFNPQLTGRQNITYVGQMLGLASDYLDQRTGDIISFAELGSYIDQPTRAYSSGMFARLSFSMYAYLEPDILMVDEVLAVGDAAFKRKCFDRIEEMLKEEGRATIYVSHGMPTVARLATRVMWIDRGRLRAIGEPVEIINQYLVENGEAAMAATQVAMPAAPPAEPQPQAARPVPEAQVLWRGDANESDTPATAVAVWLENERREVVQVGYALTRVTVCFAVRWNEAIEHPSLRVTLIDDSGTEVTSADTAELELPTPCYAAGQTQVMRSAVKHGLPAGRYRVVVSCADAAGVELLRTTDPIAMTVIAFPSATGLPTRFELPELDLPIDAPSRVENG